VDADVVVIGAGALGLSTALHCALAGRSVAVVERHTAGSQASGRATGLFKSVQADELRTALARRSITRAMTFADWAGAPLKTVRPGSFLIARTDQHRQFLCRELDQSRGWGADVREATPAELAERLTYYRPVGDYFAVSCPEDIYIEDPASLIQAYLAACQRHGAAVIENEPVIGIPVTAGRVTGVETERRSIAAPVVVDAAGGWVRQVAGLAGAWVPLAPVRHQLLITQPTPQVDPAGPIIRVVDAALYLRPARGGLMIGGFEPDPLPVDPRHQPPSFSTDDVPLDLGVLLQLAAQVAAEVPLASTAPVAEHRGGLFTMSPDGRFVTGPVPDLPGLWVASGCNGSGFSSSLGIGEAVAAWITTGTPPLGLTALSPARFGPLPDHALVSRGLWQYAHYYDPTTPEPGLSLPEESAATPPPRNPGHWPTRPSTLSRSRSAWPLWRAYSSIMWSSTSRSATVVPSFMGTLKARSGESATNFSAKATSSRQARQASSTTAGSAAAPSQSASGTSSDQYNGGASACAITRRNQWRSTSAMWRTRPSRDIVDGGTDRSASWAASRSAHFISSVSRWKRR
jgi:glycine/D-amino acid oxidase-like deaminating enzyme